MYDASLNIFGSSLSCHQRSDAQSWRWSCFPNGPVFRRIRDDCQCCVCCRTATDLREHCQYCQRCLCQFMACRHLAIHLGMAMSRFARCMLPRVGSHLKAIPVMSPSTRRHSVTTSVTIGNVKVTMILGPLGRLRSLGREIPRELKAKPKSWDDSSWNAVSADAAASWNATASWEENQIPGPWPLAHSPSDDLFARASRSP